MQTLEGHKVFPFIAWTTLILFALLTYFLAAELQETTAYLEEVTQEKVDAIEGV